MAVKDMAGGEDELESADAEPLDLTPRAAHSSSGRGKAKFAYVGLGAIVVLLGFLVANTLSKATTFFYNVDEALEKKSEIGEERVRLQGNVLEDSIDQKANGVSFRLAFHGESVQVDHSGQVPDLFQPAIPVVVVGKFNGQRFVSDQILVKHDEKYEEDNKDRINDAETDAKDNEQAARGATTTTTEPSEESAP